MTQLTWNDIGDRFFEAGVDRGVLFTSDGAGVAWNGLISVSEAPSGGEATPYYLDGVKYLNVSGLEEFGATIEAYTYPEEFAEYDGTIEFGGLSAHHQIRKPFGLSYRTQIGNDIDGSGHGYKIHLIYNALAEPTEKSYSSIGEDLEPLTFSWSITTTPIDVVATNLAPLSHISIDSRKTTLTQMRIIEEFIYGAPRRSRITDGYLVVVEGAPSRMPTLDELFHLFENPLVTLNIMANPVTGLSPLIESVTAEGDLFGATNLGLYSAPTETRLVESLPEGLYLLDT